MKSIDEIRQDFHWLKDEYEIVWHGSRIVGGARPQSDYDIAIITRNPNEDQNIKLQWKILGLVGNEYDIRIFELFPIHIQMSIISGYEVVFGNSLEISEYFYHFRKIWANCQHRVLYS